MTHRRMAVTLVAGLALYALAGCSSTSSKDLLPGAVFAADLVPVYKSAELSDQMGSESWGDTPESYTKGNCWFFKTKTPKDKIVAFYAEKFPGAERTTGEDGDITFKLRPEGASEYEDVYVTVSDGEIRIGESFRPERENAKKHKATD